MVETSKKCPKCGSSDVVSFSSWNESGSHVIHITGYTCMNCIHHWENAKLKRVRK